MRSRYINKDYQSKNVGANNYSPLRAALKLKILLVLVSALILLLVSAPLSASQYGKTVLAFYKTSDGFNEKNNPVKTLLEAEIKKLGLNVEYRSFESGMPSKGALDDIRAVVTWYYGGVAESKKKALDYIDFLKSAVDSGSKLVIINSFGAYGYKEDGVEKWDLVNDINPLFNKLGFAFKGYWTNDPSKLRIADINSFMVEKGGKQDVNISKHYQQIAPLLKRQDVETHLTIKRTDKVDGIGDGNSSVILTSKNGGFALETYVISAGKLMLNVSEFLYKSLFFDDRVQDVCVVIGDIKNKDSVVNNFKYAFKYAKIKSTFIDAEQLSPVIGDDLLPYDVLVLATETVNNIPFNAVRDYVNKGGNLIFANPANLNDQFRDLAGIKEYGGKDKFKEGFEFDPDFTMNRVPVKAEGNTVTVRRAMLSKCRVLATVLDKTEKQRYPVLWEKTLGKGRILYWNIDQILNGDKGFRGAIVQCIHYIRDNFVTGMANIGMMMIDDLPAPLWNLNYREYRIDYYEKLLKDESNSREQEKIKSIIKKLRNYSNITDTNFIKDTWIKDIESFEKKFGFKYSTFLIFNYNRNTNIKKDKSDNSFPIEDFYLSENNAVVKIAERIRTNGWELALHGYNHQSLTLTKPEHYDSLPWQDKNTMLAALNSAKKEWISIFGEFALPFTYVAPHNIIDNAGISALAEVFPSINVLATLYVSDQGESEQEFEWTKDRRFFQIPRISSGYIVNPANKYFIYDCIFNFGVVSHFVHPDDVFDVSRSSGFAGWDAMKAGFEEEFTQVKKCNPSLRWMTAKDAFDEFQFYNSVNIRVKESGKTITVESSDGSERYFYFRMRLRKGQKIKSTQNCQIVNANYVSGDVMLKSTEYISRIMLN